MSMTQLKCFFLIKLFESMDKAEDVRLIELLEVLAHEYQPQAICPEVEVTGEPPSRLLSGPSGAGC